MPVGWRRTRDGSDGLVASGGSLVDEVLEVMGVFVRARCAGSEGEAEEGEVVGGGDDAGLRGATHVYADSGEVDAEVGDGRRVGEAEGDLEFVARARRGLQGGGVVGVWVRRFVFLPGPGPWQPAYPRSRIFFVSLASERQELLIDETTN